MTRLNTTEANTAPLRRSTDYVTPHSRMAPLAEALLRDPNVMCHALVQALRAAKGPVAAQIITHKLNQEANL
jgi:hypothetical protein